MDEEKLNPQGGEPENGGQAGVVDPQDKKTETGAETEDQHKEAGESGSEAEGAKKAGDGGRQSDEDREHETNNRMKAARLAGDKAGADRASREADRRIAAQKISDPYHPGKYFESVADFEEYGRKVRADAQKVSVDEIKRDDEDREYIRKKREEDEQSAKERGAEQERAEFIRTDAANFLRAYPTVDPAKLEKDERFVEFCGSRLYREPLAKLYAAYVKLVDGAGKAAVEKKQSKDERSTGSGAGAGSDALKPEQQKALDDWNAAYPSMKMTAKEFLHR